MTHKNNDWKADWESTRKANLFRFAKSTPEQKIQWLRDMLYLVNSIRKARSAPKERLKR